MKNMLSIMALLYSSCVTGNDQFLLLDWSQSLTPVYDDLFITQKTCKIGPKYISGYWENWKGPINPGPGTTSDSSHY